jgi:EAL domain-containing protein (putative c-di-GMP-specific phosphodiesterase class I)
VSPSPIRAFRRKPETASPLEEDLREAIGTDQLSLHYQPIVDLATHRVVSVEALLRWTHPDRGAIGPSEFVPVAEEAGTIVELGRWVLERACTEFAGALHQAGDPPLELAVNISARQLTDAGLPVFLAELMQRTGLGDGRLALEITETALTRDGDAPADLLCELRALGTRIVLDDFGSGYSSIGHLRRFPIDAIKIDRSFIDGLGEQSPDAAIVGAILPMARALDLAVVAEGVETEGKVAHLHALGCRQAQGFLFAHPAPMDEVAELVAAAAGPRVEQRIHPRLRLARSRFKAALAVGDSGQAAGVVRDAVACGFDGLEIQVQVIGPAISQIRDAGEAGHLTPAEVHLAAAIAERSLSIVFDAMAAGVRVRRGARRLAEAS